MSLWYILGMAPDLEDLENGLLFIEIDRFGDVADEYLGDEGRAAVVDLLLENPEVGDTVEGTGGARKMRVALPGKGKGKSGGARVIYYYRKSRFVVYLLCLYPKSQQASLRAEDKRWLKAEIKKINAEDYP